MMASWDNLEELVPLRRLITLRVFFKAAAESLLYPYGIDRLHIYLIYLG
jgi:hypothetical protein